MSVFAWTLVGGFALAQGGAIFGTAYFAWRKFSLKSASWKPALMIISYLGWIALTLAAYTGLGGDGGLMDGFGMLLTLFLTAAISSFIYLCAWLLAPYFWSIRSQKGLRAGRDVVKSST